IQNDCNGLRDYCFVVNYKHNTICLWHNAPNSLSMKSNTDGNSSEAHQHSQERVIQQSFPLALD
ncbi:MAG: hypothetical protein WBW03_31615, partial [Silvibacterium sp.]